MNHSIERVFTGRGQERFELRVWNRGRAGKQLKRRFKTRRLALNALDDLKEKDKISASDLSFGAEFDFWKKHQAEKSFAPGWLSNIDTYWRQLKNFISERPVSKIDASFLKEIEHHLRSIGNSQKTINNKIGFIRAVLNFSVSMNRASGGDVARYSLSKAKAPDIQFWERHEAIGFLSFLDERYPLGSTGRWRFSACYTVLNTALRAGELWALRTSDLKRSMSSIRIVRQFNRVSKQFAPTKGKKARSVPMNSELLTELDLLTCKDLIFSFDEKPVCHDAFHDWFDVEVKAWGGRRITFHGLRHTAATLMLEGGVNVKTLQDIMGHESITTTMKYVHALSSDVRNVAMNFSVKPEVKSLRIVN